MSIEIKKSKKPVKYDRAIKLMEKRLLDIHEKKFRELIWVLEHNDIYTAPREIVGSIGGIEIREMKRQGTTSFCCGAGGGRMWMEEATGKKVNIERVEEAVETGADEVAVACPFCYIMMDDGMKEIGQGDNVRVRDVSLILLDNLRKD